jgi:hypothetical protein
VVPRFKLLQLRSKLADAKLNNKWLSEMLSTALFLTRRKWLKRKSAL